MQFGGMLILLLSLVWFPAEVLAEEVSPGTGYVSELPPELAPEEVEVGPPPAVYQPAPLGQRLSAMDFVGGAKRAYVHPFLSVSEIYTDNYFNDPDNEENEFLTVLSPGIWAALPASRQQLIDIDTLNTAPGGIELSRFRPERQRRLQAYGMYRADLRRNENFPDEETNSHFFEGLLSYAFRGGLSFELLDIYQMDQDAYATGVSRRQLDDFTSNLLSFSTDYDYSPKLQLGGGYRMYTLDYDEGRNRFRERQDDALAASVSYRFLPKTSFLLDYEYIAIDYDSPERVDSNNHQMMGGFDWRPNSRSRARLLLGLGRKNFDRGFDTENEFIGEAQVDFTISPKTSFYLRASRFLNETDIEGTRDILAHRVLFRYLQKLTGRINAAAELSYMNEDYRGDVVSNGLVGERNDDYYTAGLTLGYSFRAWLNLSLGYSYGKRESNFDDFSYDRNSVYLSLTAAL